MGTEITISDRLPSCDRLLNHRQTGKNLQTAKALIVTSDARWEIVRGASSLDVVNLDNININIQFMTEASVIVVDCGDVITDAHAF